MIRARILLLSAAPVALLTAPALAQDALTTRDVEVSAARLPVTQAEAGISISVVTQQEIERGGYRQVADVLESLPGVSIARTGGTGAATSVFVRGMTGEHLLVLIDGVPMNDPSNTGGGYDFAMLDASIVERIELLRGAQATLWGAGASSGVVSITTKRAKSGKGATVFAEGGSWGHFRSGATLHAAGETGDFALSLVRGHDDGYSATNADSPNYEPDADGNESRQVAFNGGIALPEDGRLGLTFTHKLSEFEYDSSWFAGSEQETEENTIALNLDQPLFDGAVLLQAQGGYADIERRYNSGYETGGTRRFARVQATGDVNDWNTVSLGYERDDAQSGGRESILNSGFALLETRPVDKLTLSFGGRFDFHNTFDDAWTGRASAAYEAIDGLVLRGGIGRAFKVPSLNQITYNDQLVPEESTGWEIGFDYDDPQGRYGLGATWFDESVDDEIFWDPSVGAWGSYANLDSEYQGLELTGRLRLTETLSLRANYTYIDATDAVTGERLVRRPKHSGSAALTFADGAFSGSVIVTARGSAPDAVDYVGDDWIDEWIRVDVAGSYQLTETVQVYGRVENLFDADYEYAEGYNTAGLSGYLGLRASF